MLILVKNFGNLGRVFSQPTLSRKPLKIPPVMSWKGPPRQDLIPCLLKLTARSEVELFSHYLISHLISVTTDHNRLNTTHGSIQECLALRDLKRKSSKRKEKRSSKSCLGENSDVLSLHPKCLGALAFPPFPSPWLKSSPSHLHHEVGPPWWTRCLLDFSLSLNPRCVSGIH